MGLKKKELIRYEEIIVAIKKIDLTEYSNEDLLNQSNKLREEIIVDKKAKDNIINGFALVREAVRRTLGFVVNDVQLLAALALNDKKLIEMQTGEGKTVTAVFPAYINGLSGKGVHILTFNDYLAKRDALWMKPIYELLGMKVGYVEENMTLAQKKMAYYSDITYVTAKESGFDYLRDTIAYRREELVHREFNFAIVDEADSILIDEARIPLVIAKDMDNKEEDITKIRTAISKLDPELHYQTDEYKFNIFLTENGVSKVEELLKCDNLYEEGNFNLLRLINATLYAEKLICKDVDYIVKNGKIEMIDEFTGRLAKNRQWADGIQAALEVKENLQAQKKSSIMTQITLQHFIMLYPNLSCMTGTARDSEEEFFEYYDKELVIIPPNKENIRIDLRNYIFTHKEAKVNALVKEIQEVNKKGQPVLIGTSSVKESLHLAEKLKEVAVSCNVLNAKNDELEAQIISKAGMLGAVTVSTNMAGRGVDILLGGETGEEREKIIELGGLYVIGTNLHESLRIDKQLKGRAGRQGEPGVTRFFVSLEDDLIEKYGIVTLIPKKYYPKNQSEPLKNPVFNKKILAAQRIVQGQLSEHRKSLYRYSVILEDQRRFICNEKMEILDKEIDEFDKAIRLYHFNDAWADYLRRVANIKESINFSVYSGKNPLYAYHLQLIDEFSELKKDIEKAIEEDYIKLEALEVTREELANRSKKPLSTWTYLLNDNSIEAFLGLIPEVFVINIAKTINLGKVKEILSIVEFASESYLCNKFKAK